MELNREVFPGPEPLCAGEYIAKPGIRLAVRPSLDEPSGAQVQNIFERNKTTQNSFEQSEKLGVAQKSAPVKKKSVDSREEGA